MISSAYLTAGQVMDKAAALMNDTQKQIYTYAVQMPYLNMALQDLRKEMELNNSQVTNETSTDPIQINAGVRIIKFNNPSGPSLPNDLVEIQQLWIAVQGQADNWIPMTRRDFLPHYLDDLEVNQWLLWAWMSNEIRLLPMNAVNFIKIDYIRNLFANINHSGNNINVIDADSYLECRTAYYLAKFVAENPERAGDLAGLAQMAWDKMAGIDNKGKQAIFTRRMPFRARWKNRGTV